MSTERSSALPQAEGLLKNLQDNLDGADGDLWLKNLTFFLRKEQCDWAPPTVWKVWKSINNVSRFTSTSMVEGVYSSLGVAIYDRALAMVKKMFTWSFNFGTPKNYPVRIALVSIMDLGFNENEDVQFDKVVKRALKKGLKKVTAFDALEIRAQWTDQLFANNVYATAVAVMSPIDGQVFEFCNNHGKITLGSINKTATFTKEAVFAFRID